MVSVLAAILMPMATVVSEVTLVASPPSVVVKEAKDTELPISPGGGLHDLSLPSEPKAPEGSVARTELGRPVASHANEVVEIPSDDEADIAAGPPVSSRELVVVQPEAGSSGGPPEGDVEWPCPERVSSLLSFSQ